MTNEPYTLFITDPDLSGEVKITRGERFSTIFGTVNCRLNQLLTFYTVTSAAVPEAYRLDRRACYEIPAVYKQFGAQHIGNVGFCYHDEKITIEMLDCPHDINTNVQATIIFNGAIAL